MGQTLTHGIYLPDEGERNCYNGLAANWQLLDGAVGTVAEHTSALSGKAPLVHTHTKADITDFPAYGTTAGTICEGNDSRLSDARTPVAHTHVTADVTDLLNTSHEWTKEQLCDEGFTAKSTTIERCVTPETIKHINFTFKDKNDKGIGAVRRYFRNNGIQELQVFGTTRIKDNQYDETGSDEFFGFSESIKPDGTKAFSFDGYMGSNLNPLSANQSIGSASNQWNNLYAKNYFYNGVAWGLDKVNEWSNTNYFNKTLFCDFSNLANKAIPNAYIQDPLIIVEGNTSPKTWHGGIALERYTNGDEGFQLLTCSYVNGATQQLGALRYLVSGDGTESYCYSRGPTKQHLGTSANKWTTLNGVNPGALSFPSENASSVNLDPTNWNITGTTANRYTPPADGWLGVQVMSKDTVDLTGQYLFVGRATGGSDYYPEGGTTSINVNSGQGSLMGQVFIPVISGKEYHIRIKIGVNLTNGSSITARFYTCQGNV